MTNKLILINLETILEYDIKSPKLNSEDFSDKIKEKLINMAGEGYHFGIFSKNNDRQEIIQILNDNLLDDRMFDIIVNVPFSQSFKFAEEVIYEIRKNDFSIDSTLVVNLFSLISAFQSLKFKEIVVSHFNNIKTIADEFLKAGEIIND